MLFRFDLISGWYVSTRASHYARNHAHRLDDGEQIDLLAATAVFAALAVCYAWCFDRVTTWNPLRDLYAAAAMLCGGVGAYFAITTVWATVWGAFVGRCDDFIGRDRAPGTATEESISFGWITVALLVSAYAVSGRLAVLRNPWSGVLVEWTAYALIYIMPFATAFVAVTAWRIQRR